MPARVIRGRFRRAAFATLIATLVASFADAFWLPLAVDPSHPPLGREVLWLVLLQPIFVLFVTGSWLLPACGLIRYVAGMRSRGIRRASIVGLATGLGAFAMVSIGILLNDRLARDSEQWVRGAMLMIEVALFPVAWFVSFEAFSPSPAERPVVAGTGLASPFSLRIAHGARNALIGVLVGLWTLSLGLAQPTRIEPPREVVSYRLVSSWPAPQAGVRACVVRRGCEGTGSQVYVLGATEVWSPDRRGLLMWESPNHDPVNVRWRSDHALDVRVRTWRNEAPKETHAYARSGFTPRTEPIP